MKGDRTGGISTTLMFGSVVVKDSNSKTSKEFQDVPIELVGKEIYIGSNYKIKWKHTTLLRCKNDVNEPDETETDNETKSSSSSSPRGLQEYRDVDYETAGFVLTCALDTKKKSEHKNMNNNTNNYGADDSREHHTERTFWVRYPFPPEGQRSLGTVWENFRKALEGGYQKELRKRQRKAEKERALLEEERHEHEMRRKESRSSRSSFRRSTYSKRPYDFMRKNAANIAHNAEVWTDDEDENDQEEAPMVSEPTPELVTEEKEETAAVRSEEDESENEFGDGFGTTTTMDKDDHASGVEDAKDDAEDIEDRSSPKNLVDEDDDDSVINLVATKSRSAKKRRIKRRGPVLDDSDDDDDNNLFQTNTGEMTGPGASAQRVVTPATAKTTVNALLDDDQDGKGNKPEKEQEQDNETDEEESVRNNKKINSFFQPRSKTKSTAKSDLDKKSKKNDETKPRANESVSKDSVFAPKSKSSPLVPPKTKIPLRVQSPSKKRRTPTATKNILDNDRSDSDEASTVDGEVPAASEETKKQDANAPSRSPFLRARSPKPRTSPFEIVRASESKTHEERKSIEDEDPIVDVESSQSQQSPTKRPSSLLKRGRFSGGRLASSIKKRRLKMNAATSALEALEFADARAHHLRSPVSVSRKNATATKAVPNTGERSPLQPLKLGPQVEMAASTNPTTTKWRGLRNDGNSCYVNSSLQQLFSVPTFLQAMEGFRQEGHELTTKLSDLYANLNSKKNDKPTAASAKPVKKVVDKLTDRFHGYQQRDAHEFLGEVIDQIHEELAPSPEGENKENESNDCESKPPMERCVPTDEFFRWNVQVCLKCKNCGYSRSKEEMYRYLSIDIGHSNANTPDSESVKPAVDSCLANFFAPEDREVNCEKCKVGKIATQTMKILSIPKVILLHLKRFMVVEKQGPEETELVFKKNKVPVELTTTLSVGKLLTDNQSSNKLPLEDYRLKSIVHHLGNTANSGHYTTDALRADPEDGREQWVSFDDGMVAEKSLDKIVRTVKNQKTAYMLLYSRD